MNCNAGALLEQAESSLLDRIRGDRISFRHPLIRAAILQTISPEELVSFHRSIASSLDPTHDADRIALHLGAVAQPGDNEAARLLSEFARRAQRRGAHAEAADAWRRASDLTRDSDASAAFLLESGKTIYFTGDALGGIKVAAPSETR